ncbi:hypothetical protein D3C80_2066940 [compost metagenome]
MEHQIGVHQQADRHAGVFLADSGQHFEALSRRDARGESAQRRTLNGWTVSQRIGERDTQLQRVGAGFNQGIDDLQ